MGDTAIHLYATRRAPCRSYCRGTPSRTRVACRVSSANRGRHRFLVRCTCCHRGPKPLCSLRGDRNCGAWLLVFSDLVRNSHSLRRGARGAVSSSLIVFSTAVVRPL